MGGREAAGATSRSVEAFQLCNNGNAKERKPAGSRTSEKAPKKKSEQKRREDSFEGPHKEAEIHQQALR